MSLGMLNVVPSWEAFVRMCDLQNYRGLPAKVVNDEQNRKAHCKHSARTQKPALRMRMP